MSCLGMPREEADRLRGKWMRVDSSGSPPVVTFIEAHWHTRARYSGIDLFGAPARRGGGGGRPAGGAEPPGLPAGEAQLSVPGPQHAALAGRGCPTSRAGRGQNTFQSVSIHLPDYYLGGGRCGRSCERLRTGREPGGSPDPARDFGFWELVALSRGPGMVSGVVRRTRPAHEPRRSG